MSAQGDLDRRLGLGAVVAISISSMLGSGIFVLPGVAFVDTGSGLWLAYVLASFSVLPAALSKAELATAMPSSGGTYVYVERTFGPLAGTVGGLGLWLSLLLKSSFALIGIGAYLSVMSQLDVVSVALVMLMVILLLNVLGVGKLGNAVIVLVGFSLISLIVISGVAAFSFDPSQLAQPLPAGVEGILAGAALVFVSYAGVTKVAAVAEEVVQPERNLPRGILISLGIVSLIYAGITLLMAGTVPMASLAGDHKPVYTMSFAVGGPYLGYFAAFVAILTMFSMANAGVLAASRFPFAMSRDYLLPPLLGHLHPRFLTPFNSILFSCAIIAAALVLLDVAGIAKLASTFILMIYVVENIAVIVLRETRVQWYAPRFRSPFYPWLQIAGVASGVGLMVSMADYILPALAVILLPGALLYFGYSRRRTSRRGVVGMRGRRLDLSDQAPDEADSLPSAAKVVVPLFGYEHSPETLTEFALSLSGPDKLVEVVHLKEVPEQSALQVFDPYSGSEVRSLRRRLRALAEEKRALIHFDPVISHDIFRTVHRISWRLHCQWLIKEWGGQTRGTLTINNPMRWLEDHLACRILTFKDAGIRNFRKIMVLQRPDLQDSFIIKVAEDLARSYGAHICLATYVADDAEEAEVDVAEARLRQLARDCQVAHFIKVIRGQRAVESIVDTSVEFDLMVMRDQSKRSRLQRYFGSKTDRVLAQAACSVVSVFG